MKAMQYTGEFIFVASYVDENLLTFIIWLENIIYPSLFLSRYFYALVSSRRFK